MKKLTFLALAVLSIGSLQAQNKFKSPAGKKPAQATSANNNAFAKNGNPSVAVTIFSEDFASGLPATWTSADSAGNAEVWAYSTTGPVNYPTLALASTSAANGWMIFDDDNYGNNSTVASASLTTPSFDCSGQAQVFLSVEEQFRQYLTGQGVIYVSNDGTTWTDVHHAETGLIQDASTTNPLVPIIDISAVAGNQATVYLKFTYRGDWDYFWQIDDISVFVPSSIDISSLSAKPLSAEYTQVPKLQLSNAILAGEVKNVGLNTTSGGTALFEVVDAISSAVVFNETVNLPAIAPLAIAIINTTTPFTPSTTGTYKVRMTVSLSGDANPANDINESATTLVSDSVYARDNDVNSGSLGIGAGPADGIVGQNFTVTTAQQITSISFFLTDQMDPNPAGSPIWVTLHNQVPGSEPDLNAFATSETVIITPGSIATGGQWFTVPINNAGWALNLAPGLYFAGVHEADSTLTLGTSTDIATPGTVWVSWSSIPSPPAVNGWANADDFGFSIAYQLRLNFGNTTGTGINSAAGTSGIDIYPNPTNGIINISNSQTKGTDFNVNVYNAVGQSVYTANYTTLTKASIDLSAQPAGVYHVKINSSLGSIDKSIVISNK